MPKLITGPILLGYPHLFVPKAMKEGDTPRYSLRGYLAYPGRDDIDREAAIKFVREYYAAAQEDAEARWPGKGRAWVKAAAINVREIAEGGAKTLMEEVVGKEGKPSLGLTFRFGLRADVGGSDPEGVLFFNAGNPEAPGVVSRYADPATGKARRITDPRDVYAGMIARVSMGVGASKREDNRGINLYLNNVQKYADGDRLGGGRASAESEFDAVMEAELAFGDNPEDMESVLG